MSFALTRARTIERQAEGLRLALVRLASGEGPATEAKTMIDAMLEQLRLAERLVDELRRG